MVFKLSPLLTLAVLEIYPLESQEQKLKFDQLQK